ncbi:unnamed protein product [Diamesa serratosioi]
MNSKLINHKNKCRCCLAKFRRRDDKLLITPIIQQKFQDLTRAELKLTDEYSKFICHNCYNELNATDKLRRSIMIESQVRIADYKDLTKTKLTSQNVDTNSKDKEAPLQRKTHIVEPPTKETEPEDDDKTENNRIFSNGSLPNEFKEPATKNYQNSFESDSK